MNPESGTEVTPDLPELPAEVFDADEADPGEVAEARAEQAQTRSGKYGSTRVAAGSGQAGASAASEDEDEDEALSSMTFELLDDSEAPIANEPYEVRLPDGSTRTGRTDAQGRVQLDGVEDGDTEVTFPRLQDGDWDQQ